jgi:methionine-rich copper-binding protein CopC
MLGGRCVEGFAFRRLIADSCAPEQEDRLPTNDIFSSTRRLILAALIGLAPGPAAAHAILQQSQPPAGGSIPAGKVSMQFIYNSRVDRERSRLTLTRPDQSQAVLPISADGAPNVINASTTLSVPGAYNVRWQVLAVDGHITRGDVPFTVTGP